MTGGVLAQLLGLRPVFAIMAVATLALLAGRALLAGMVIVTNDRMAAAEAPTPG